VLTDTHAHLFDCSADDLETLVNEAISAGVGIIVNTATSIQTGKTVLDQCKRYPQNLKPAVGISPFDTVEAGAGWVDELKKLLEDPAVVAVGEIGLDDTNPIYPSLDIQLPFFKKQLEIAADVNLPAIVHSRGIEKKTAEICREIGVSRAIFHCFTGDLEALEYIIDCGYYVSISGIVTYKNSHLRDIIRNIPVDKLLIESDAPYLSPIPHRGKKNRPAFIVHTAKEVARILNVDEIRLSEVLKKNVEELF
jgi:TatD DNase family protein